jgi:hypothetical protein
VTVPDRAAFERKLPEGKEFSVLFDINSAYKKEVVENSADMAGTFPGVKVNLYLLINNNQPKKSVFSLYFGKTCIVTVPLTSHFKKFILNAIGKARSVNGAV